MKYPKITVSYIKFPVLVGSKLWRKHVNKTDQKNSKFKNGDWIGAILHEDKRIVPDSYAAHNNEESCWVCCHAYNQRVGFSKLETEKIIKTLFDGKKEKKAKKQKSKKGNSKRKFKFKKS